MFESMIKKFSNVQSQQYLFFLYLPFLDGRTYPEYNIEQLHSQKAQSDQFVKGLWCEMVIIHTEGCQFWNLHAMIIKYFKLILKSRLCLQRTICIYIRSLRHMYVVHVCKYINTIFVNYIRDIFYIIWYNNNIL